MNSTLEQSPVDCIILDAFSDLFSGNINQSNEVRTFLNKYTDLAKKYNCFILFLHHIGKRTENSEPSKNNILGSQGFEAKMRVVLELRVDKTQQFIRNLFIVKGNYLTNDVKGKAFKLHFDENMLFHDIGVEESSSDSGSKYDKNLINLVFSLRQEKKSLRDIAKILTDSGVKISHTQVSAIIQEWKSERDSAEGTDNPGKRSLSEEESEGELV